jgi:hypothetical protein
MNQEANESEQILLYSTDEESSAPSKETFANITLRLSQYNKWKMQRKIFKVHDNKILSVVDLSLTASKKYWFQLCHLDPQPERLRALDYRLGIVSIILGLNAYLLTYLNNHFNLNNWILSYTSIMTLLITAALIVFAFMLYKSKNLVVYHSYYGQHPIALLLNNNPSKSDFDQFITKLSTLITQARKAKIIEKSQALASELSEMRRLKDESVISNDEYDEIKQHILSHHSTH